jgi:hypothetical protein
MCFIEIFVNLKEINLSNNKIKQIDGFTGLTGVQIIDLSYFFCLFR